jgi:hypothetical protein
VYVGIKIFRHVVVYDVGNALNVDTTSCDVGCDKDTVTTIFKSVKRLLTLSLREVAVKRRYVLSTTSKLLSEALSGMLHLGKHNDKSFAILFQPVRENFRLRLLCNLIHRVGDRGICIPDLHLNQSRIVKNPVRQFTNLIRHSCGEEKRLTLRWNL